MRWIRPVHLLSILNMTRINASYRLSDQLLNTELGEIGRIFDAIVKKIEKNQKVCGIPEAYRLGPGHMKFFYNKMQYLYSRYYKLRAIYYQRHSKHYSKDHKNLIDGRFRIIQKNRPELCGRWVETQEAKFEWRRRILEKSLNYKRTHTHCGEPITDWQKFLEVL